MKQCSKCNHQHKSKDSQCGTWFVANNGYQGQQCNCPNTYKQKGKQKRS